MSRIFQSNSRIKNTYILFHGVYPTSKMEVITFFLAFCIKGSGLSCNTRTWDQIERADSFNFLVIVIDKHILKCYLTKSQIIVGAIQLKKYLPLLILRTMYFSKVRSHLNYGLLALGFDSYLIIKLQKRCVIMITRSKYNAQTQPLMKQFNILSVPDMLLLN